MRIAKLVLVLALLVAYLCVDVFMMAKSAEAPQSFPLLPGTYWIYQGLVRSQLQDSTVGEVTDVAWKTSVVRAVRRDGLLVAVVSGLPSDLNWSDGHSKPSPSIIIEAQRGVFYLISSTEAPSIIDHLDDPQYPLHELVREDRLFLQLPLTTGARFGCDEGARKRNDGKYCWVVGDPHPASLGNVKGLVPQKRVAYQVEYDTNPDDEEFEFVPGIGITSYGYHHHGTIADTELHLVEFHSGDTTQ